MFDERDVHRVPLPRPLSDFILEAGAGEEMKACLMQGDGQNPVSIVICILYPVAVVGIQVKVRNPQPL